MSYESRQWDRIVDGATATGAWIINHPADAVAAIQALPALVRERDELAAAVDRVRKRHPRGDEESSALAPGLWCPTCGRERTDNGYGGCPDRNALTTPTPSVEVTRRARHEESTP